MSSEQPFTAIAPSLPVTVTSTASTSAALPAAGGVLRCVNEGPNIAFLAITVKATAAVATLPNATPTNTSIPVPVGDVTLTIPNDQVYNVSAICRANQTAQLTIQVSEGI